MNEVSPLEISVREIKPGTGGPYVIVSVSGQAGVEDSAGFRQLLKVRAGRDGARMIIDLSRLSSMDWWAALILLWMARVMHRRGRRLLLAAPRPAVARMLRSAGAHQVIPVYETVQQATSAVPAFQPSGDRSFISRDTR